jgi:hypothetical protein
MAGQIESGKESSIISRLGMDNTKKKIDNGQGALAELSSETRNGGCPMIERTVKWLVQEIGPCVHQTIGLKFG